MNEEEILSLLEGNIILFIVFFSPDNACGSRNSKTARGLSLPKSVSSRFARSKRIYLGGKINIARERERRKNKAAPIRRGVYGKRDSSLHRMSPINT